MSVVGRRRDGFHHDPCTGRSGLEANNHDTILKLRQLAPELKSAKGEHFADILERLMIKKLARLAEELSRVWPGSEEDGGAITAGDHPKPDRENTDTAADDFVASRERSRPAGRCVIEGKNTVAHEASPVSQGSHRTVAENKGTIAQEASPVGQSPHPKDGFAIEDRKAPDQDALPGKPSTPGWTRICRAIDRASFWAFGRLSTDSKRIFQR